MGREKSKPSFETLANGKKRKTLANGKKRKSSFKTLANGKKRKLGPYLPKSILKTIAIKKRRLNDELDSDDGDFYEYEEGVPEEESRRNNRVDSNEFELPEVFEDEIVESKDDDDDDDRQLMLQALSRMRLSAAFQEGESENRRNIDDLLLIQRIYGMRTDMQSGMQS